MIWHVQHFVFLWYHTNRLKVFEVAVDELLKISASIFTNQLYICSRSMLRSSSERLLNESFAEELNGHTYFLSCAKLLLLMIYGTHAKTWFSLDMCFMYAVCEGTSTQFNDNKILFNVVVATFKLWPRLQVLMTTWASIEKRTRFYRSIQV